MIRPPFLLYTGLSLIFPSLSYFSRIMLNVFILDDDISCIETLQVLLQEYCPGVHLAGTARSVKAAVQEIQKQQPQLVFLDVEVGTELGFDLFSYFPQPFFKVVFTTGHREYALQAIKASCLDFLVKPIDIEELKSAVQKAETHVKETEQHKKIEVLLSQFTPKADQAKIAVNCPSGYEFIKKDDIIYCEAKLNYTEVYLLNGKKLVASRSLKDFEEVLDPNLYYRCHKSFLVNINHIEKVNREDGMQARMPNGKWIDISVRKKEEFLKLFAKF